MNVRKEYRQAFRQYRRRLGLPVTCPSSDVRVGDLCYFNIDGTVGTLGNVLEGSDEKCVTTAVDASVDPIISNGMRCRSLSTDELTKYNSATVVLTLGTSSRSMMWMKPTCCQGRSLTSLIMLFFLPA